MLPGATDCGAEPTVKTSPVTDREDVRPTFGDWVLDRVWESLGQQNRSNLKIPLKYL